MVIALPRKWSSIVCAYRLTFSNLSGVDSMLETCWHARCWAQSSSSLNSFISGKYDNIFYVLTKFWRSLKDTITDKWQSSDKRWITFYWEVWKMTTRKNLDASSRLHSEETVVSVFSDINKADHFLKKVLPMLSPLLNDSEIQWKINAKILYNTYVLINLVKFLLRAISITGCYIWTK